jgi:hypothetical protein
MGGGVAIAAWMSTQPGAAWARASVVGGGTKPVVSATGQTVSVTWAVAQLVGGTPVDDYTVSRFDVGGVRHPVSGGCASVVSATACVDVGVPPGVWTYAVTPVRGTWTGPEGPQSDPVAVSASGGVLNLAPSTLSALPATLGGGVTGFTPGETVAFRLDDPATGTSLSASVVPSTIPADGAAAVSVTIPSGAAEGPHTVYALGSFGSQASAAVLRDGTPPTLGASVVQKASGGTAGWVRPAGSFFVYANATDDGAPPVGFGSVTADVSAIVAGHTAVSLQTGSWTIGGVTYAFRSASLTADPSLAPGLMPVGVTATDAVGNAAGTGFFVSVDATTPTISSLVIQKVAGGSTAAVAQGGQYFAYANVTDPGGSGIEAVTADVSAITTGASGTGMTAGSWAVGAVTYGYRSALLTADLPLAGGVRSFTATASDGAGNTTLSAAGTVTVDNAGPVVGAVTVQKSAGGASGRLRQGGLYYAYANVTDAGGSGIESVTADVGAITAGASATAMTAGRGRSAARRIPIGPGSSRSTRCSERAPSSTSSPRATGPGTRRRPRRPCSPSTTPPRRASTSRPRTRAAERSVAPRQATRSRTRSARRSTRRRS